MRTTLLAKASLSKWQSSSGDFGVCAQTRLLPSLPHAKYLGSSSPPHHRTPHLSVSFSHFDSVAFYRCWFLSECHAAIERWCWGLFMKWDLRFLSVYNNPTQRVCIVSCYMVWLQNYFFVQFPTTAAKVLFLRFLICWRVLKKRGMYSLWLESRVSAAVQGLNVSPVRPHIHAKPTFVCTVFFFFVVYFPVHCSVWWCLDLFNRCES